MLFITMLQCIDHLARFFLFSLGWQSVEFTRCVWCTTFVMVIRVYHFAGLNVVDHSEVFFWQECNSGGRGDMSQV